jgi:hypothetical protein
MVNLQRNVPSFSIVGQKPRPVKILVCSLIANSQQVLVVNLPLRK